MALVSIDNVNISFGNVPLIVDGTAQIEVGDRVVLLGRNGCGKSTLLRILAGEVAPDAGRLHWRPGVRTGYLPQEIPPDLEGSIYQVVAGALALQSAQLQEYAKASSAVASVPGPESLARLDRAQRAVETSGAWELHERVERTLSDLQLAGEALFGALSGGLKRRVLMARALAAQPDLLLLDEPTNHLDIDTICRLEERLAAFKGSIVIVTHDRALARRLATRVLDIDRGRLRAWPCGYDEFCRRKEEALVAEEAEWHRMDKKLAQEEAWIRQGVKARRTRNEGRVKALLRLRTERAQRRTAEGSATIRCQEAGRTGDTIMEVRGLSFGWGAEPLVSGLTTRIMAGDRIGILGPNGSGKTTLLRLLLGRLEPDSGRVVHGTHLEVVYYDQLRSDLDVDRTVVETVADGNDTVLLDGKPTHVHAYLARFLFARDRMNQPVSALSGGERNRLMLARIFTRPCNVLVMDEPTNDLDAETLEVLEQLLVDFTGTLLLVSHDREFLDNVVTNTLVIEGHGKVTEYAGGYSDWLQQRDAADPTPEPPAPSRPQKERSRPAGPRKLTFSEKRELPALESHIQALECEVAALHTRLADPAFYRGNPAEIAGSRRRLLDIEVELKAAYARWEELETIRSQQH